MGRPIAADDLAGIRLWCFRDLREDQRLGLFRLLGWPETTTQTSQLIALRSVMGLSPERKAAPEVRRTQSA